MRDVSSAKNVVPLLTCFTSLYLFTKRFVKKLMQLLLYLLVLLYILAFTVLALLYLASAGALELRDVCCSCCFTYLLLLYLLAFT